MEEYILQTDQLTKMYGFNFAVDHVSMKIKKGEVYGLVGKNGSGKTTLIRLITGLVVPTGGTFTIFDKNHEHKKNLVSAIVETPSVYLSLNGYKNMKMQSLIINKNADQIDSILNDVGLSEVAHSKLKVKDYSLGMRQRLGLAITLLSDPEFLILDEPMNGLDPEGIKDIREIIMKLAQRGLTILISSHILDELSKVATRYGIMDRGKIIREITTEELHDACHHRYEFVLDQTEHLEEVLTVGGYKKFRLEMQNRLIIEDQIEITFFINLLASVGIRVLSMQESSRTIEEFYLEIIGGKKNA